MTGPIHASDAFGAAEIRRFKDEGLWRDEVLGDFLTRNAQDRPSETAVVAEDDRLTWAELAASVDRLAAGFVGLGLRPGDFVAMQLPNSIEFVQTYLAVHRAGLRALTLMTIYRHKDVEFMIGKTGAKVLVVPGTHRGFSYSNMACDIQRGCPSLAHLIRVGDGTEAGMLAFDDLVQTDALAPADYALLRPDPDSCSKVSFTSGTTGRPKGVVHTHNTDMVPTRFFTQVAGITASTPIWMPSPIAHVTGLLFGVYGSLMAGAKLVLQDAWDPLRALELIERERPKATVSATPFVAAMLDQDTANYDLSSFTHFMSGGARIPPVLVERARDEMGINLLRVFGSAEAPLHTANWAEDDWAKITGRDGRAFPGVEVRIVEPSDHSVEVPRGGLGEYATRGPHVFLGYHDDPERTAECRDADGWYYQGDLCEMDEDGYVLYVDRVKDIVNRGGVKISALEVENELVQHPAIQSAAIVAMPDERLGEHACAFVILREGAELTLEDIGQFLKARGVTTQKWPEELCVVDAFPVTPTGKVRKTELREYNSRRLDATSTANGS